MFIKVRKFDTLRTFHEGKLDLASVTSKNSMHIKNIILFIESIQMVQLKTTFDILNEYVYEVNINQHHCYSI